MTEVLVTGGAGFIGSNFVRHALAAHPDWQITTLDKLTYAGRLENLHDVMDHPRHAFVKGDIADQAVAAPLVQRSGIVVHFAAETHVDRSIASAGEFIRTDVVGTYVLLEAARRASGLQRFVQISTDEVYGSVSEGHSLETDEIRPRNPYSASKAGADRLAYSYFATYGVPVVITRASNNYGPYQFPEKVIPLFVTNALDGLPLPLYGDGGNVRDWLHVLDHCRAIDLLIAAGTNGEVYNVGGGNELTNLDLARQILAMTGRPASLITRVQDRPGHDRRYAVDTTKTRALGWTPSTPFAEGLRKTVDWYQANPWWWRPIKEQDPGVKSVLQIAVREGLDGGMSQPALVTGAAGFAGGHLVESARGGGDRDRRLEPAGRSSRGQGRARPMARG